VFPFSACTIFNASITAELCRPVGYFATQVSICFFALFEIHNISCMLNGADDLVSYLEKKLGVKTGQVTKDGLLNVKKVSIWTSVKQT
jgi:hypothetical protein